MGTREGKSPGPRKKRAWGHARGGRVPVPRGSARRRNAQEGRLGYRAGKRRQGARSTHLRPAKSSCTALRLRSSSALSASIPQMRRFRGPARASVWRGGGGLGGAPQLPSHERHTRRAPPTTVAALKLAAAGRRRRTTVPDPTPSIPPTHLADSGYPAAWAVRGGHPGAWRRRRPPAVLPPSPAARTSCPTECRGGACGS